MRGKRKHGRFGRAFIVLYGAFFFVFFLGYASPYLPPETFWWTGLLASILPYLTVLVLLVALLAWAILRGSWYVPVILLLFLAGIRFLDVARLLPAPAGAEDDLVVMTYNAPVRGPNPDTLSEVTLHLIEQIEPDILALQEPVIWMRGRRPVRKATAHLQAIIDSLAYWAPTPQGVGGSDKLAQPVIARFPLGDPDQYTLPFRAGSFEEEPARPTYITRMPFEWGGRAAVFYNVHLYTTGARKPWLEAENWLDPRVWLDFLRQYREAYLRRVSEARYLRELLEQETLPFIVAGDFNSTIHHWEFRHVAEGLTDAFTARGQGWGGTYHMQLPLFRIDHILVSPEWEVVTAYVPATETLSDHRPVVARLQWEEDGE